MAVSRRDLGDPSIVAVISPVSIIPTETIGVPNAVKTT
jgi:hypothetical protein